MDRSEKLDHSILNQAARDGKSKQMQEITATFGESGKFYRVSLRLLLTSATDMAWS